MYIYEYIYTYIYIYIYTWYIYIYIYAIFKYELVLTPTECSTFYGANLTWWRKTLKYDSNFHAIDAIMRYSNYSTWFLSQWLILQFDYSHWLNNQVE